MKEILQNILNKNKPVIFVSGHFANFELMSMELTREAINLAIIYRPLNNLFLNPAFIGLVRVQDVRQQPVAQENM